MGVREAVDTRQIVADMRSHGMRGVVSRKDLTEYTGRSKWWVQKRFGPLKDGISIVSAARILGGLCNDA